MSDLIEKLSGQTLNLGPEGVEPPLQEIKRQARLGARLRLQREHEEEFERYKTKEWENLLEKWGRSVILNHEGVDKKHLPEYVQEVLEEVESAEAD